jgi:hypothetical protein
MQKVYIDMTSDSSGWNDTYYYLVFDEESGELYVERSWSNWSPNGTKEGSENISLTELKQRRDDVYQKAVKLIMTIFPSEENKET